VYHGYGLLKRQDAGGSLFGRKAAIIGGDVAMDADLRATGDGA